MGVRTETSADMRSLGAASSHYRREKSRVWGRDRDDSTAASAGWRSSAIAVRPAGSLPLADIRRSNEMDVRLAIPGIASLLLVLSPSAVAQNGLIVQSSPGVNAQKPTAPSELGKGQYLLTIPHVIGHDNPHGCTNAGWDYMTNLCKAELGPASGRSDAGCWSQRDLWQCTFACQIYHPVIP